MTDNIETIIESAKTSNPAAFNKAVTAEISTRLHEALMEKRQEVVGAMFDLGEDQTTDE